MITNYIGFNIILLFIVVGAVFGIIYDIFNIIKLILKKNILVNNVLDFFAVIIGGFLLILTIFKFNFGEFALFELLLFMFGLIFEQIIIKIWFTTPFKWVYNVLKLRKGKKDVLKYDNSLNL